MPRPILAAVGYTAGVGQRANGTEGPGTSEEIRVGGAHPTAVAVIGAGRVGTAFAVLLERAGYRVAAATGQDATRDRVRRYLSFSHFYPLDRAHEAVGQGRVVIIGVPDDAIADVCGELSERNAFQRGQFVLHLSG